MQPARCAWETYRCGTVVLAIEEDRDETLWFGTLNGICRFDGLSWTTYTVGEGFANYVHAVLEDSDGDLWFATEGGGALRYDGVNWHTYTKADGLADSVVSAIEEDHSGNLWFGTLGGATRYDGESWRTYTTADGLPDNRVNAIMEDSSGSIWFGTFGGVARFDGTTWTTYTTADSLVSNGVHEILQDHNGIVWVGTDHGLCRYDGQSWTTVLIAWIDGLLEDRVGNLWVATSGGVYRFDGVSWRKYTVADGLTDDRVHAIFQDSSGSLWFGTQWFTSRYDGVDAAWTTYTSADGLAYNTVYSIGEDHNQNLWFGTLSKGVSRYDGMTWTTYTVNEGLAGNTVFAIHGDNTGNLWFGTTAGVSRYDSTGWTTYTTADGLAAEDVYSIEVDRLGNLWFGTNGGGVSRYDGTSWTTFTTADGLAGNIVSAIVEDHLGNLWLGTSKGVSRYDGVSWQTYTTADGLVYDMVDTIAEDRAGALWFGTLHGVSRFDGTSWRIYTYSDGLADSKVKSILLDTYGNLWFGTRGGGVTRYDGAGNWGTYNTYDDGLVNPYGLAMLEDHAGTLWIGTYQGVSRHEPDRVTSQTVISVSPANLSPSKAQNIVFECAFGEAAGIEFSYSVDGSPWSDWSPTGSWFGVDLAETQHVFRVKSRDFIGNTDPTPAECTFEIDATAPAPVIAYPAFGQAVRDSVLLRGTSADLRFKTSRVEVRPLGAAGWELLVQSSVAATDSVLCDWNTSPLADGDYELRLSVTDTLGLTGSVLTRVIVDNHTPWAYETAPAMVSVTSGGDIYTTNGEVHLYFPPHAFARETEIDIVEQTESDVPDTLSNGAVRMLSGYEISWGGAELEKVATLELSYEGWEPMTSGSAYVMPALYVFDADASWRRVGGTVDEQGERVSAAITEPGRYALFLEQPRTGGTGASTLSALSLTPRVFSPSGAFANDHVAIGFTLGRSTPVTVKVYNRAGRLVREVLSGEVMGAGANLVRWDGRDDNADIAPGGLYLVSVEAMGRREGKTISIVR